MQKPQGMSRKEARQLRRALRWYVGAPCVVILEGGQAYASRVTYDEEGYSRVTAFAYVEEGVIMVESHCDARDCDGRLSSSQSGRIQSLKRARPHYRKGPRSAFRFRRETETRRDYSAEAAGY